MLTDFVWKSKDQGGKNRVNKKQSLEIDSVASSGGEGKLTLHLASAWGGIVNIKRQLFCQKRSCEKEVLKAKEAASNAEL